MPCLKSAERTGRKMYENLLYQPVDLQLKSDIEKGKFPGAVLFSGPEGAGKLTAALETSRILSCVNNPKAKWDCKCPSCVRNRALTSTSLLLLGPRDCVQEIKASASTFIASIKKNAPYITASRYLFVRSIRKLTLRFSQILWEHDEKLSKIAGITGAIDEELETLDFPHELPEISSVEKSIEKLEKLSMELEDSFLYDSIPVNQIRNLASWARMKSVDGKNTVIIENADRMLESVRNALLKILEEPPEGTVFILTTSRKSSIMPTILSRVRQYAFSERTLPNQQDVIKKVFHEEDFSGGIKEFLQDFLPVSPVEIRKKALEFLKDISERKIPYVSSIVKDMNGFEPGSMLKIFLDGINCSTKKLMLFPEGLKALEEMNTSVRECYSRVTVYNQGVQAALELLVRDIYRINRSGGNILKCVTM